MTKRWGQAAIRGTGDAGTGRDGTGADAAGRAADRRTHAERRESRVAAGLSELERWLADQVGHGIAQARQTGPSDWDDLARRLVDAQAPGVAGTVTRLSRVLGAEDWPGLLLGEYALLHLLAVAHRRSAALPEPLRQTVRARVGFPVTRESVLATPAVRDHWHVVGDRDEEQERLVARRVWLAGRTTGRRAMVLSFSPAGQPAEPFPPPGATIDADLAFYPGASPLRALVAGQRGPVDAGPPPGTAVSEAPALIAEVLAADPWTDSWPLVLAGAVPGMDGVADGEGNALPLHPAAGVPWRLLAVSGGRPVTVAAEWTPRGLLPLTVWDERGGAVRL
ncbi:SWIM zinc finger family protein [Microbispora sp. H11081]|uniref:SWIM zinc finger family protein n=1 Tax=Microbispora sp. H11081 TaxID=2729107 RepID=UPI0014741745|nr:SWIM zinc finger family protein [Microbispora sp. H11081]